MPEVPQHQSTRADHDLLSTSVIFIAVASILFSIWAVFVGFHHSLFDFHAFRQTQTAITAEYMQSGGPFLRYQTPILGPPWSIPLEFPLYQKIVALIAQQLRAPLDETGRAISIAFFYLCLFPLTSILKRLHYRPVQILAALSLFAVSPLYIFVSRMFMIESTVLFLSLLYLDRIITLVTAGKPWGYRDMVLAALFGSLAGLVKVTTFAPFLLLGGAIALWQIWTQHRSHTLLRSRAAAIILLCGVIPLSATVWWTRFAAAVREQNPFCPFLLGKSAVSGTFGPLSERLHPANYVHFLHAVPGQAGSLPLLLLLGLAYAVVVRRWNIAALISLAFYVITPMIFFNVHLIHAYYPYASAIFLLIGVGLLIADFLDVPGPRAWLGFAFLVALIAACLIRYRSGFYQLQRWDAPGLPAVTAMIDRTTNPRDVIVITGLDWSSELPYQSHRRAIMDPEAVANAFPSALGPIATTINNQHAETIPELVACGDARASSRTQALLQLLGIRSSVALHADNCDIYQRSAQ